MQHVAFNGHGSSFLTFIGIIVWAYARKNAADFEKAANLPFEQD